MNNFQYIFIYSTTGKNYYKNNDKNIIKKISRILIK